MQNVFVDYLLCEQKQFHRSFIKSDDTQEKVSQSDLTLTNLLPLNKIIFQDHLPVTKIF